MVLPFRIILFGPPGSGKSTQGALLGKRIPNLCHFSTGENFRAKIAEGNPDAIRAAAFMSRGDLVPPDISNAMATEALTSEKFSTTGWVLDGFPRESENLKIFQHSDENAALLKNTLVVRLHADKDELVRRLSGRKRPDDTLDTILKRIDLNEASESTIIADLAALGELSIVEIETSPRDPEAVFSAVCREIHRVIATTNTTGCCCSSAQREALRLWSEPKPFVVGIQSGRGHKECVRLLQHAGFSAAEETITASASRSFMFPRGRVPLDWHWGGEQIDSAPNPPFWHQEQNRSSAVVKYITMKPRDIRHALLDGLIDACVCYDDVMYHSTTPGIRKNQLKPLVEFADCLLPRPYLAIVGRKGADLSCESNRIVSEYEDTPRLLHNLGIKGSVIHITGSSEGFLTSGLADLALVVVQTGDTLRINDLCVHQKVRDIRVGLFVNTDNDCGLALYSAVPEEKRPTLFRKGASVVLLDGDNGCREGDICAILDAVNCDVRLWPVVFRRAQEFVSSPSLPLHQGRISVVSSPSLPLHHVRIKSGLDDDDDGVRYSSPASTSVVRIDKLGYNGAIDSIKVLVGIHDDITTAAISREANKDEVEDDDNDPVHTIDPDNVSAEEFKTLPLVIEGESKEVRYAGKGLVLIYFKPTIYSFTHNRCAEVQGSAELRLRSCRIFTELFRRNGIRHAYKCVGKTHVLAELVMPHESEFRKYGLPLFVPLDLNEQEIANLPRGPPIEVIIKTFHGGTSKHRFLGMSGTRVRDSHPCFKGIPIPAEEPYPAPFVRFDWRNPLNRQRDSSVRPPSEGVRHLCTDWAESLELRQSLLQDQEFRNMSEFVKTTLDPKTTRVPDETLPEALADLFIDTTNARQLALNVLHVMQSFLEECDMVCNDLCLFISEDGRTVFGEISQDCGRFRHYDLGSLDKDVWRGGGSAETVLEKWKLQAELIEAGLAKTTDMLVSGATAAILPLERALKLHATTSLDLFLGTTNPFKIRELAAMMVHLPSVKLRPTQMPRDVEEPYDTFEANARTKALAYAFFTGGLTLAEDSGISVHQLSNLPGPWSARFSDFGTINVSTGKLSDYVESGRNRIEIDRANNARLLELTADLPEPVTAQFDVAVCIAVPGRILAEFKVSTSGRVIKGPPRGTNGFGYDPVFIADNTGGLTYAELDPFRKNLRSFRRRVSHQVVRWLVENMESFSSRPKSLPSFI